MPWRAGQLVPLNAGRFDELLDMLRHEHVKAVAGVEHAQAGSAILASSASD